MKNGKAGPKNTSHASWGCAWLIVIIIAGVLIAAQRDGAEREPAEIPVTGNTPEKDSRKARQLIARAVGSDGLSFEINDYYASPDRKVVKVHFNIGDNLTDGMIRFGAKADITSILRATDESGIKVYEVTVFGSFPLLDKFGNSEREVVVKATYSGATVSRINWPNFLTDDIYEVADSAWLHPAFRE